LEQDFSEHQQDVIQVNLEGLILSRSPWVH